MDRVGASFARGTTRPSIAEPGLPGPRDRTAPVARRPGARGRDRRAPPCSALALLALCATLIGACAPAPGRDAEALKLWGTVEARLLGAPFEAASLWLTPEDRSDASYVFGVAMEQALRARGVALAPEGARLRYGAELDAGTPWPQPEIALQGTLGSSSRADLGVGVHLPILDEESPRRFRFAVRFAVLGPEGTPLWEARARGEARGYSVAEVAREVANRLTGHVGRALAATAFSR